MVNWLLMDLRSPGVVSRVVNDYELKGPIRRVSTVFQMEEIILERKYGFR